MRKPTKLKKKSKKMIRKLSDFLGNLPKKKLEMNHVGHLNGSKEMNPTECDSAGCGMGWSPLVFPNLLAYHINKEVEDGVSIYLIKNPKKENYEAIAAALKIPQIDADYLFCAGTAKYHTPKQVAKGLRKYAETGLVPRRCFDYGNEYEQYMEEDIDEEKEEKSEPQKEEVQS